MSERKYYLYKLVREEEVEFVFFRPKNSNRIPELLGYKMCGYDIVATYKLTEEEWHNAKLRYYSKEYCDLDKEERELHTKYISGVSKHSEDSFIETLTLIQDRKWFLLKMIHRYIRTMVNRDLDIQDEIAIQLNDQYLKAIL